MRTNGGMRLAAALLVSSMAGCGGPTDGAISPAARDTIDIDGSRAVFPISRAARDSYATSHPDVNVVVDGRGTEQGFRSYLSGELDVVGASRPATPGEEARARAQGIAWTRFVVGRDGGPLFLYVKNASMRRSGMYGFLRYYLENVEELARRAGCTPPTAEECAANLEALPEGGDRVVRAPEKTP